MESDVRPPEGGRVRGGRARPDGIERPPVQQLPKEISHLWLPGGTAGAMSPEGGAAPFGARRRRSTPHHRGGAAHGPGSSENVSTARGRYRRDEVTCRPRGSGTCLDTICRVHMTEPTRRCPSWTAELHAIDHLRRDGSRVRRRTGDTPSYRQALQVVTLHASPRRHGRSRDGEGSPPRWLSSGVRPVPHLALSVNGERGRSSCGVSRLGCRPGGWSYELGIGVITRPRTQCRSW